MSISKLQQPFDETRKSYFHFLLEDVEEVRMRGSKYACQGG